jgi:hypothetical protein
MIYPICQGHHRCKEAECFSRTSIDKGTCDCPYKGSCHLTRQEIQVEIREKYGCKIEDCDFYKVLKSMYEKSEKEK